jgi:hypothetical protein
MGERMMIDVQPANNALGAAEAAIGAEPASQLAQHAADGHTAPGVGVIRATLAALAADKSGEVDEDGALRVSSITAYDAAEQQNTVGLER